MQLVLVILIGIVVAVYLAYKLFKCFCNKKARNNHCDDCPGCILHPKKD